MTSQPRHFSETSTQSSGQVIGSTTAMLEPTGGEASRMPRRPLSEKLTIQQTMTDGMNYKGSNSVTVNADALLAKETELFLWSL